MFKFDRKFILGASAAAAVAMLATGCVESGDAAAPTASSADNVLTYANGKRVIDGGRYYATVNDKSGPYYVNTAAEKGGYTYGRTPTANELEAWNTTVTPWRLPPKGEGTAEEGEAVYEAKCVMCHGDFGSGGGGYPALSKGNAYDNMATLKHQRTGPDMEGPIRVFGNYWPEASTLWWYIMEGMPHPDTRTLTDDEVYGLVAYILNLNEMEIDGEEVDYEYVLDQEKFAKIVMPNKDGFEPVIDGANGLENVRAYFADPANFGAQKIASADERCMSNCQKETAKVVPISIEQKDFLPPLSQVRDLPEVENTAGVDLEAKNTYESSCAVCHGAAGMGAPVVGDKKAWDAVVGKGMDQVYARAINGTDAGMPPKGGTDLSDDKLKAVVDYMISQSK
ncbi:c-type cytochrome [Sulfurimonas sp. ST-25]|uniref:c-type cytochrome n=1 Tax=Sulfurimonas sp. ST-25 TaxID=3400151 RepID=UPI003A87C2AD